METMSQRKVKTEIELVDEKSIDMGIIRKAGRILREGGLVAFPTETVYGLGADALDADAAKKIYAAKGRPSDNPLIVHICRIEDLYGIVTEVTQAAKLLAEAFWPGPLTMILNKSENVPYQTTGGMDTVAVRMPSNKIALALIKEGGGYIAAPSANTSGRSSPTLAEHVYEDMDGRIPLILDGGAVGIGIESTIIDLTEKKPVILRPGYITPRMLSKVIGEVAVDPGILAEGSGQKPKAPGMKYKHYAPNADLVLVEGEPDKVIAKINGLAKINIAEGKQVGIIGAQETVANYKQGMVVSIGERRNEEMIAHNLYKILRQFDKSGVDVIYSESFETPGLGQAIMNRLWKAAGYQIMEAK